MEDYTKTAAFQQNLENQGKFFEDYYASHRNDNPFNDWSGFLYNYYNLRAGLSSLRRNPDTMNDPDFVELCNTWETQSLGHIDNERIDELYKKLAEKPVFSENAIFNNLFGYYCKGIYELLNGLYYTENFFKID